MDNQQIHDSTEGIAVIGMVGRFPGAKNIDEFWQHLCNGQESVSFFSDEELKVSGIDPAWLDDPNYVKAGACLSDIEMFDAPFFDFSPREAELMDPQHRILLECAWEALETAGYAPGANKGLTGVYVGTNLSIYMLSLLSSHSDLMKSMDSLIALGNDHNFPATKVSYKLNLTGPSINVSTACSTSLVAVHSACQGLLNYECNLALAGGASIQSVQKQGYFYEEGGITSPDGHCRAFDAKAQGTIFGDGVGIVVLKRLEDALADGDCIYAVIQGSAINNDGAAKVGYTAPSVGGQTKVIVEAQAIAGFNPETITYIETHGTGTALGDPIEISALKKTFEARTQKKRFCAIGSVKPNVGHLNIASGVTSFIKAVMALKHKVIPPSLHYEQPNPETDFANSPFYVNTELTEWKTNGTPRRAGVSSFGFGGTNAHVILEEPPVVEPSSTSRTWQLLLLSAKTSTALTTTTAALANHLQQHPDLNLADVVHTLQVGRRAFDHRRVLVCHDLDDAVKALASQNPQRIFTNYFKQSHCRVIFMFSGQGAQYVNMARELYEVEPTFKQHVDTCAQILVPLLNLDIRQILFPHEQQIEEASQQLQQTAITQPALFVIEYALAQLWREWGVHPEAMIGHSIGEYVAATIAGVFSLEDALAVVATRGKLMQQLPSGSMPTIPLLEPFVQALNKVKLNPPRLRFISNVTGSWITNEQATNPSYWGQHLRQTVRFSAGISQLLEQFEGVFLEVGPGRTLSTLTTQHLKSQAKQQVLSSLHHAKEPQSDVKFLLQTLGRLWLAGVEIDWSGFYTHEHRHRLPLSTYPFERQRYWIEPKKLGGDNHLIPASLEKKPNIADWFYIPFWKPSVPPVPIKQEQLTSQKSCTLVFMDECGLGTQLLKGLQTHNHDVITVKVGDKFAQLSESLYTLNPGESNHYNTLLTELLTQQKLPETIVHLWNVTSVSETQSGLIEVEKAQETGFYSLLFLAQALGKQNLSRHLTITVVSNNMQSVTGEELLSPEKATLLGPVKVIPQEYPNISCRSIDVILPPIGSWQQEKLTDQLLTELRLPTSERVIAYRSNNRWVQTFEPVRLEESVEETPRLREGGSYLITGGLGGIGLVLAKHLAKTVRAKLILIGRSAIPARLEWDNWLATHSETDSTSHKIEKVKELEELGAEVLVISADVANLTQMTDAIAQAQQQFGQLHGVIHAAGVPGGGVIQRKTQEEAKSILAPKVNGTLALDAVVKDIKLDFLLLTSSITSILGEFGQVDYTAANAFLDVFAHYKISQQNSFTLCINWGAWQEVGMAVNTARSKELQEWYMENLQQGILPKEGVDAVMLLFGSSLSQVVVSPIDFLSLWENHNSDSYLLSQLEKVNISKPKYPRPELSSTYVAPSNEVEQKIADIWQNLLGIEQVGIHDNFFELGGDSLLTIKVQSKLQATFNKDFVTTDLFEYPTISDLAEHISGEQVKQRAIEQAHDRAKRKQNAMAERIQLLKLKGKVNG